MGCNACDGTTGLITNGSGGYNNAMPMISPTGTTYMMYADGSGAGEGYIGGNEPAPFINAGMLSQPSTPINASQAASGGFINVPTTISDINNASNSYMNAAGNPVMANPNLPAVTEDQCNSIKCGVPNASTVPLMTLVACSNSYGAGNWDLCTDARCAPYRGSSCSPSAPTTATPLATQFPNQPLTPAFLTTPAPDITASQNWGVAPQQMGPSTACLVASWINDNAFLACALLVGAAFLMKGK